MAWRRQVCVRAKRGLGIIINAQDARKTPFILSRRSCLSEPGLGSRELSFQSGATLCSWVRSVEKHVDRRQLDVCLSSRARQEERSETRNRFFQQISHVSNHTRRPRGEGVIDGGSNQSRECNFRGKHSHQSTRMARIGSIEILEISFWKD